MMKSKSLSSQAVGFAAAVLVMLAQGQPAAGGLPVDEPGAIAYLKEKGVVISTDADGHAVKLMSQGKPPISVDEYQLIGLLPQLEEVGLNAAPLADGEWAFLQSLKRLKKLAIWHGHGFRTLEPFNGLPVESLVIGGCMGLRDLNRSEPAAFRNAVLTLRDLPNLRRLSLYHSPLAPDDGHLSHIAGSFPQLEDLKLDFASPTESASRITPSGIAALRKLPLTVLTIENVQHLDADHFRSIAGITSLKTLLIDGRRSGVSTDAIAAFSAQRPEVEVVIAAEGDPNPPRPRKTPSSSRSVK